MSTNFFSSLSGKFDLNASMSSLYGDYSQIKNGSYGTLMKSYVKKVGNGSALKAYKENGTTASVTGSTSSSESSTSTTTKKTTAKTSFLDSHLSSIKSSGTYTKSELLQKLKDQDNAATLQATEATAGANLDTTI